MYYMLKEYFLLESFFMWHTYAIILKSRQVPTWIVGYLSFEQFRIQINNLIKIIHF